MATNVNPAKKVDLPPSGNRNADPISDEPGAHPIETGIGAAVAGAASGLVAGAVAGPIAAAVGVAVGAVAGGYAGKAIGEEIDPTLEDHWLQDQFRSRPYVLVGFALDWRAVCTGGIKKPSGVCDRAPIWMHVF
jgi:hypothetical protein